MDHIDIHQLHVLVRRKHEREAPEPMPEQWRVAKHFQRVAPHFPADIGGNAAAARSLEALQQCRPEREGERRRQQRD